MEHGVFTEISLIIAVALVVSTILRLMKQPLIIGYILTGILVGPSVFDLVHAEDTVDAFSNLGIALLLFIVGLGLNPRVIKEVGKVAVITGVGQVMFTTLFGMGILKVLGYEGSALIYVAVALAFSSTIIVLKLLNDKKEQNRLHGKISIGFLLVQDIIATVALLVASATGEGGIDSGDIINLVGKGLMIAGGLLFVSVEVLPRLTKFISSSQEFLFLFAIGWGFGIGALMAEAGFSLEVGALFAGVSLASLPYAQEVSSRLRPLRDFFIVLFFIALGARLGLDNISEVLPHAIILSLFVLIGNPLIVTSIMGILGYTRKTSFKAGLAVAQISEFSLVFVLLGARVGQIDSTTVSLVTMVALITIAISSYMIIYSDQIYNSIEHYLRFFERSKTHSDNTRALSYNAVLFGYRKGGDEFVRLFKSLHKSYVVVDYDPEMIDVLEHQRMHYLYGDVTDIELLNEISLDKTKMVISTISDHATNIFILKHVLQENPHAIVMCHSETATEASELYEMGATYVLMPHYLGTEKISSFIKRKGLKKTEFKKYREKHLEYLQSHHS